MGLPGLQKWMLEKYPRAFVSIPEKEAIEAEHVLIDLNSLLHRVVQKSKDWVSRLIDLRFINNR